MYVIILVLPVLPGSQKEGVLGKKTAWGWVGRTRKGKEGCAQKKSIGVRVQCNPLPPGISKLRELKVLKSLFGQPASIT